MTLRTPVPPIETRRAGVLSDWHFVWAIVAALPVWLLGYLWFAPATRWDWPVRFPHELLALGLIYPVVEEVLFRGLMQPWLLRCAALQRRRLGLSYANWITSIAFASLHFFAHPPLAAASVLLPSLAFGYFRDRHGNLRAPIVLHMYYNIGYFWIFTG